MRLSRELDGKMIVSISDGRILGKTKDVYLDPDLRNMTGFHIGREGLIKRKDILIQREDIVLLGQDAILVKDSDVFTDDQQVPGAKLWLRQDDLDGRQVVTPGGTKLGIVGDVVLDDNGAVREIALSRVLVEGPLAEKRNIPREAVLDVGKDGESMMVDLAIMEKLFGTGFSGEADDGAETATSAVLSTSVAAPEADEVLTVDVEDTQDTDEAPAETESE